MPRLADLSPEVRDSPVYWFTVLEIARERDDYALAAEAERELRRLGVRVTRIRRRAEGASNA